MPEEELEARLYGHSPPLFENDIGDIGHIKKDLTSIMTEINSAKSFIMGWRFLLLVVVPVLGGFLLTVLNFMKE